ncbi:MAG: hypothetical protein LQ338_001420 [Usnochroma carphineum]|nr:MAG: hypothetical protein LQ338_001420 [Usnochroma carphineum]
METTSSPDSYSSLTGAQSAEPHAAVDDEAAQQTQSNQNVEQHYQDWPKSSYSDVSVLLLRWAADSLGVIDEVSKFEKTLRKRFNYATEQWDIPSEEPEWALTSKILEFCKGKRKNDLLILYYAGHGGGGPEECIWSAMESDKSPCLNWHKIQGHLLAHESDVLVILGCCFSSLAARVNSIGTNWFLGSSVKESVALGVHWRSFTSAMVRQLQRAANMYWYEREPYDVLSLEHDLNLREDLRVTPHCLRLNSDYREPTDLTPLVPMLYRQQRPILASARTDPVSVESSQLPRGSVFSRRLRNEHVTLPPSNLISEGNQQSLERGNDMVAIDLAANDYQTLRIKGLPLDARAEDVVRLVEGALGSKLVIVKIGPMMPASSFQSTTVTFANAAEAKRALALQRKRVSSGRGQHEPSIEIDHEFHGFTTIYDSSRALVHESNADIVLLHDPYGHPINSFASHCVTSHHEGTTIENCWPRDHLPRKLEAEGIFPRVLTYGWPAATRLDSHEACQHAVEKLRTCLRDVRPDPKRPLIFIAHGLGGILAKNAIASLINFGLGDDDFQNPVKLCVFFGVPHRGLEQEMDFATVLGKMKSFSIGNGPSSTSTNELRQLDGFLANISQEFAQIQSEYAIRVLSFAEKMGTGRQVAVPINCASFNQASGLTSEIGATFQNLAKLRHVDDGARKASEVIDAKVVETLGKKASPVSARATKKENVYERLRNYDTFFLIDDSASMEPRWHTTARVLANIVSIAVKYDDDGVDVKFFNKRIDKKERTNLNTTEKVMALFAKNTPPRGGTLTADELEEVLNDFIVRYRRDPDIKGLNLIVLTDGEPDPGQDVEEVLKEYATALKDAGAHRFKVGVQFVQIGGDERARKFLKLLDDELKAKHKLDRDMIDTVYWAEEDKGHLHEKILLGGILKRLDND